MLVHQNPGNLGAPPPPQVSQVCSSPRKGEQLKRQHPGENPQGSWCQKGCLISAGKDRGTLRTKMLAGGDSGGGGRGYGLLNLKRRNTVQPCSCNWYDLKCRCSEVLEKPHRTARGRSLAPPPPSPNLPQLLPTS